MLASGLPETISHGEDLARFLVHGSHYSLVMVKPAAFLPNPNDHETSVARHGRAPVEMLGQLGVQAAGDRRLHGAAILSAQAVRSVGLEVTPDEPPPRHAVIRGWPWDAADPELQKAKQKELALRLASAAGEPVLFG